MFIPYPKKALFQLIIGLLFGLLLFSTASAQYFGQNNVVYRNFKFKILKTAHFNVYYYSAEEPGVRDAARMAERWYARHSKMLDHELGGRQPLILYASSPQFFETNVVQGLGEGVGGVTEPLKRRIVLPFAGPLKETDHVIGHELVHAFQYDLSGQRGGTGAIQNQAVEKLPLWFIEGMAEFLSIGPYDANTAMYLRDAVASKKKLPKIKNLDDPEYFPYRWGQALLAYIAGRWGDKTIGEMLSVAGTSGSIDDAFIQVLSTTSDTLSRDWQAAIHQEYDSLAQITKTPKDYGKRILGGNKKKSRYNVGPVLSPDGKSLIFFSERSLFGIDLYLADAETGKVRKKLVETELDPHFSSLEFIYSAGSWAPQGDRIVFSAIVKDYPALSIYDIKRDKKIKEKSFKDLGEIYNPSWSPDGRYIAFSSLVGGFTDLFIYDIEADTLHRVTNDAYADLQPAWSPDGQRIAFVTDRYSTKLDDLMPGDYEIGIIDIKTGQISHLNLFNKGKHINPQWSSNGSNLYFVSDHDGISNIYRTDLSGGIYQITNLFTGVSGITDISPAISSARESDRLVFSAFENNSYNIYMVDSPEILKGESTLAKPAETVFGDPAMLPPQQRADSQLVSLLNDPMLGLQSSEEFTLSRYRSRLSLDYVGQPYLAAGIDPLGVQLGGGAALFWSDMLGDNNLVTALQVQTDGGFTDVGALLAYQSNRNRWIWGLEVQQVPYTLIQQGVGFDSAGNFVAQEYSFRQMNREVAGLFSYPFSRVSRVDFSAGFQYTNFSQKLRNQTLDASGNVISDITTDLPSLGSLNLGVASGAFVYDNAILGATSPVIGQRYHLEAMPVVGTINFVTGIADYRKYLMPVRPITLAFRALHYGRYGNGAQDTRLTPLFIGYQDLVRGYDAGSFNAADCGPGGSGDCDIFGRLFGSRIAVANFELRFPFFGLLHLGSGFYGALPLETGVFYDAGVAWSKGEKPSFLSGGKRKLVKSYGAVARFNILGYLVVEADFVNPVDRPSKKAFWQFNISPGF